MIQRNTTAAKRKEIVSLLISLRINGSMKGVGQVQQLLPYHKVILLISRFSNISYLFSLSPLRIYLYLRSDIFQQLEYLVNINKLQQVHALLLVVSKVITLIHAFRQETSNLFLHFTCLKGALSNDWTVDTTCFSSQGRDLSKRSRISAPDCS